MFKNKRSSCTTVLIFLLMLTASQSNAQSDKRSVLTQTTIENGLIEGIDDSGIAIYKGIPFAQPPVGDLRWRPPAEPENWNGIREAKKFGSGCMQLPVFSDMNFRSKGFSEDCLYLNVWTPAKSLDKNLPVLVYYYGGGFMAGDGSEPRYDGASMARNHGIVTVTVNYRLGVFGFMAHPELTEESPRNASGNYGLLDQTKALQWVKDNISAFGGDPNDITIAGESAGSISVSAQMASPLSRNLIAGAIGESGSIMGALPAVPLEEAENTGQHFADLIGAQSLGDLRAMVADTLLKHTGQQQAPQFSPTVDGYFFPKAPVEIYADAEQTNVPLFVGWNSQEMSYQFIMQGDDPTPENYTQKVEELYGEEADKILELYPGSTSEEAVYSATDLAGDRFIGYSTWKWSDLHSQTGNQPVYRYYYTHPRPPMIEEQKHAQNDGEEGSNDFPEPIGAAHAVEIEYLMGNLSSNNVFAWTKEDYKVSDIFQNYAANFIKNKNPNGLGVPYWSAINKGDTPKMIYIGPETQLKKEQHRERYLLLDELYHQD